MSSRAGGRSYRTDPNYYRLAYQLAAQQVNGAICRQQGRSPSTEQDRVAIRSRFEEGLRSAQDVASSTREVIDAYRERQAEYRWWRRRGPRKLNAREQRLLRFLARTVHPCAVLLAAGALLFLEEEERAEKLAEGIRAGGGRDDLSYRVYYNLACYEAGRGRHEQALEDLRIALHKVSGRRRTSLVQWAGADPSLELIRADSRYRLRFNDLLERH